MFAQVRALVTSMGSAGGSWPGRQAFVESCPDVLRSFTDVTGSTIVHLLVTAFPGEASHDDALVISGVLDLCARSDPTLISQRNASQQHAPVHLACRSRPVALAVLRPLLKSRHCRLEADGTGQALLGLLVDSEDPDIKLLIHDMALHDDHEYYSSEVASLVRLPAPAEGAAAWYDRLLGVLRCIPITSPAWEDLSASSLTFVALGSRWPVAALEQLVKLPIAGMDNKRDVCTPLWSLVHTGPGSGYNPEDWLKLVEILVLAGAGVFKTEYIDGSTALEEAVLACSKGPEREAALKVLFSSILKPVVNDASGLVDCESQLLRVIDRETHDGKGWMCGMVVCGKLLLTAVEDEMGRLQRLKVEALPSDRESADALTDAQSRLSEVAARLNDLTAATEADPAMPGLARAASAQVASVVDHVPAARAGVSTPSCAPPGTTSALGCPQSNALLLLTCCCDPSWWVGTP